MFGSLFVLRGYVHNTVFIDIKSDFDLRNTTGSRWDTIKLELSKFVVIFAELTFSLENLNQNTGLVVGVCGECLGFLGRNGCVSRNENGHDSTSGFDTKGEWSDVQEDYFVDGFGGVSGEDSGLDCGSVGYGFIGVDVSVWFFAIEEIFDQLDDHWNSGGSTDQDNIVNLVFTDARIFKNFFDRSHAGFEVVHAQFFKFSPGNCCIEIFTLDQRVYFNSCLG